MSISTGNEPSGHAYMDMWRLPRGGAECLWHLFSTDRSAEQIPRPLGRAKFDAPLLAAGALAFSQITQNEFSVCFT